MVEIKIPEPIVLKSRTVFKYHERQFAHFDEPTEVTLLPFMVSIQEISISQTGFDPSVRDVSVTLTVCDRETSKRIPLRFARTLPHNMPFHEMLRYLLMEIMSHEIDELILVNGERVFDPHRGDRVGA